MSNFYPISKQCIAQLHMKVTQNSIVTQGGVRGGDVFMRNMLSTGYFIFGCSHGAYDLIFFSPTHYNEYKIELNYAPTATNGKIFTPSDSTISLTPMVDGLEATNASITTAFRDLSFNAFGIKALLSDINSRKNHMFNNMDYRSALIRLIEIDENMKIVLNYNIGNQSVRQLVEVNGTSISQGFYTTINSSGVLTFILDDLPMMECLASIFTLFDIKDDKDVNTDSILEYFATILTNYIFSQLPEKQDVIITGMSISMVVRKLNRSEIESIALIKDFINKGWITPITPLHVKVLYNVVSRNILKITHWRLVLFWSSFMIYSLNDYLIKGILPSCENSYRYIVKQTLVNQSRLSSRHYVDNVSSPVYTMGFVFITLTQFLTELFLNMNDILPEYYPLFVKGNLRFPGPVKNEFPAPYLHGIAKFGLLDYESTVQIYVDSVSLNLKSAGYPLFYKSQVRCIDKMNSIFDRYLPNEDIIEAEFNEKDSSCRDKISDYRFGDCVTEYDIHNR
jgi:hypothetical protein